MTACKHFADRLAVTTEDNGDERTKTYTCQDCHAVIDVEHYRKERSTVYITGLGRCTSTTYSGWVMVRT